jgi:hypothetical protein
MLAIAIHEEEQPAASRTYTALDGGAVADIIGVPDHIGSSGQSHLRAAVRRTIVDHDDFRVG